MKKISATKPLRLTRETLHCLGESSLRDLQGGTTPTIPILTFTVSLALCGEVAER